MSRRTVPGSPWASTQVHLVVHPEPTFRTNPEIDDNDRHFALRVEDFDTAPDRPIRPGYAENASAGSGRKLLVKRHGPVGLLGPTVWTRTGMSLRSTRAADRSPGRAHPGPARRDPDRS